MVEEGYGGNIGAHWYYTPQITASAVQLQTAGFRFVRAVKRTTKNLFYNVQLITLANKKKIFAMVPKMF